MNIFFVVSIVLIIVVFILGIQKWKKLSSANPHSVSLFRIWFISLIALLVNLSGLFYGISRAFDSIAEQGDISPSIVAGGIKTILIKFLICFLFFIGGITVWGVLQVFKNKQIKKENL